MKHLLPAPLFLPSSRLAMIAPYSIPGPARPRRSCRGMTEDRRVRVSWLGHCLRRGLHWAGAGLLGTVLMAESVEPPPLTTAAAIRQLPAEDARQGLPVHLNGMVLDYNQHLFSDLMITDGEFGIYVSNTTELGLALRPGHLIEVVGITGEGDFAPIIVAQRITITGMGTLPPGKPISFDQLVSGSEDGQWVTIRGIFRLVTSDPKTGRQRPTIEIHTGGGRVAGRITEFDGPRAAQLVDAEVSVTGVCFPWFNRRRQFLNMHLSIPSMEQIQVIKPAPEKPFAVERRTVQSLMRFDPVGVHGHRVKVAGKVTLQLNEKTVFLRDETGGILVELSMATPTTLGDHVEALGFPAASEFSPILEDSTLRILSHHAPPAPRETNAKGAQSGNFDADLISLEARLVDRFQTANATVLVLESDQILFEAHLSHLRGAESLNSLRPGSRLNLTGVCLAQLGQQRWPEVFRLLLRSPKDVTILDAPSWWTLQRVVLALAIMTAIVIFALIWVVALRRRVLLQTQVISDKVRREAVFEERSRIAREFHDTLEQGLTGIGMQLEVAAARIDSAPKVAKEIFRIAQLMILHTRTEARSFVWELRTLALEGDGLDNALRELVNRLHDDTDIKATLSVTGPVHQLPGRTEAHLLRVAQEAVTNIIKHADAQHAKIELSHTAESALLRVSDDGRGFDLESSAGSTAGHFGLVGMRERAEKVGGHLSVFSTPGGGTTIEIKIAQRSADEITH